MAPAHRCTWFTEAARSWGFTAVEAAPDALHTSTITGNTSGVDWTIQAWISIDTEYPGSGIQCRAPGLSGPPLSSQQLTDGALPREIVVSFGQGEVGDVADLIDGLVEAGAKIARLLSRRGPAPAPPETWELFVNPAAQALDPALLEGLRSWPPAPLTPRQVKLGADPNKPPKFRLSVDPFHPLEFQAEVFGDVARTRHQIQIWQQIIATLVASGAAVVREPGSIVPPTKEQIQAIMANVVKQRQQRPS